MPAIPHTSRAPAEVERRGQERLALARIRSVRDAATQGAHGLLRVCGNHGQQAKHAVAEARHGSRVEQGGAVPTSNIRPRWPSLNMKFRSKMVVPLFATKPPTPSSPSRIGGVSPGIRLISTRISASNRIPWAEPVRPPAGRTDSSDRPRFRHGHAGAVGRRSPRSRRGAPCAQGDVVEIEADLLLQFGALAPAAGAPRRVSSSPDASCGARSTLRPVRRTG